MNANEHQWLQSQRAELAGILSHLPEEQAIDRLSLQSRINRLDDRLKAVVEPKRLPARARLTFRGRPVVRSHGIFAEFGASAVNLFTRCHCGVGRQP